jgi:hypothetical protein
LVTRRIRDRPHADCVAAVTNPALPYVFLSAGRSRRYHTTQDTPEGLDWPKMTATARWLERFIRQSCERATPPRFEAAARDDAATLRSLLALTQVLSPYAPQAQAAHALATRLPGFCDRTGRPPADLQRQVVALLSRTNAEQRLRGGIARVPVCPPDSRLALR